MAAASCSQKLDIGKQLVKIKQRRTEVKMNVNAVNSAGAQQSPIKPASSDDALSKSIKEQIMRVQKQLQELGQDKEMPMEQKMEKRKELQQQITDLNNQLRQHQIEMRKEKQQEKAEAAKAKQGEKQTEEEADKLASQAILSADSSLKQAKIQGNAATAAEDRANIVKAELKTAKGDKVIAAKQQEIAELEQTAQSAKNAQAQSIGEANKAVEAVKDNSTADGLNEAAGAREAENAQGTKNAQEAGDAQEAQDIQGTVGSADGEAKTVGNSAKSSNPTPKMYMSDGKPVEEECEPVVSARI